MDVKQSIEEHEEKFLDFIYDKLYENMKKRFQYEFYWGLIGHQSVIEQDRVEREIVPELLEKLKLIAPFHHSNIVWKMDNSGRRFNMRIMEGIYYGQPYREGIQDERHPPDGWQGWVEITFKQFDEAGFSRKFVDRAIAKYISLGEIKRKRRNFGTWMYSFCDLNPFFDGILLEKKGMDLRYDCWKECDVYDWIFDLFDDEFLQLAFEEIKQKTIEKILSHHGENVDN